MCINLLSTDSCRVLRACLHKICVVCMDKLLSAGPKCPLCRAAFSRHDADPAAALEDVEEAAAASGDAHDDEVEVLIPAEAPVAPAPLEGLEGMAAQGEDRKAVVFSTFPSFMCMIEHAAQARWVSDGRVAWWPHFAFEMLRDVYRVGCCSIEGLLLLHFSVLYKCFCCPRLLAALAGTWCKPIGHS